MELADTLPASQSRTPPSPDPTAGRPVTVLRPPTGWQMLNVRELWANRELIGFLTWRDLKVRYKQTILGAAWAILQPLMMMVVFCIFFKRMASVSSHTTSYWEYALFAYTGLLPWTFFSTAISSSSSSVVASERLITKIYFPRLAIPLAAVGAAVVDFVIACGLLVVLMAWNWNSITLGPQLLLLPVIFAAVAVAALGVGTLLAALTVSYRDFRYVVPFLIQVWMFATPTLYMDPSVENGRLAQLLALNPLAGLIGAFRAAALGNAPIDWVQLGISSACAVLMLVVGCLYFRKVEDRFADVI